MSDQGKHYFHVRVTVKDQSSWVDDEVRLDLDREELEQRFLVPYREARSIIIGGRTIAAKDIERIKVTETATSSDELKAQVQQEREAARARGRAAGVVDLTRKPSIGWYIADAGEDVTEAVMDTPLGTAAESNNPVPEASDPSSVFVIHGRDRALRDSMFDFLRAIGLHPLEWEELVLQTGSASPYIGDVLEVALSRAQAVVVLLTGDDEARLREPLLTPGDPPHETELTRQARPNVLFEAGMAMARSVDRTVLVQVGHLRPFSDIGGRHLVLLSDDSPSRQNLANRLQGAGCPVSLIGVDWHSAGSFNIAEDLLPEEAGSDE
jgi:predicted nucleotide-binding protein